jgi:hypothetical protein
LCHGSVAPSIDLVPDVEEAPVMLRRSLFAAAAGLVALVLLAPAASAAPPFSQAGYLAGGGDAEWPLLEAEWVAGPSVPGLEASTTDSLGTANRFGIEALTADTCDVVLNGDDQDLVKTADRTQLTPTQMRLRVQLDTTQPAGEFRLRDCIWIDDGDGVWEEPTETLFGIDVEPFVWVPDLSDGVGSFARFRVNLPVTSAQTVCDRGARSELEGEPAVPFLRSNTLCLPGVPDPVVPESTIVVLLPLTAAALGAGSFLLLRRRRPAFVR